MRPRRASPALEGLEPRRMLSVTLFSDGFESGSLAGWTTKTYSGGGSAPKWGDSTVKSYTGSHSAFATGSGRDTYAPSQHTGMLRGNLSLAGYGSASLTFKYFINTEAGYDFFSVNVIGSGGGPTTVFKDSGDDSGGGWHSKTISLSGFAGKSGLSLEFRFDSDATLENAAPSGVWVDDVKLTADIRPATATIRGSIFDDADGDHVRDPGEKPLSGWTVYLDQNQNRRRDGKESWRVTDDAGRYTFDDVAPGTYYVAEETRQGFVQTAPIRASVAGSSKFGITVHFADSSLDSAQRSAFTAAAKRWGRVIVGDLPDVTADGLTIDDLYIDAAARDIDGPGGVLAQASPSAFRDAAGPGGDLPYRGLVEVDTADVASLQSNGELLDVLTHEMAHALGFGTLWDQKNLLRDAGSSNPRFTGPVATAQYNMIFGRSDSGVPVENDGGPGTHDTHWRETVFGSEIMTGYVDTPPNPISRVTIGSLADLGYVVDLGAADAFSAPGHPAPSTPAGSVNVVTVAAGQTKSGVDFGNLVINQPPKVLSLTDAPDPALIGWSVTLAVSGATDSDGAVAKVEYYRETNGLAGLQVGSDRLVGTSTDPRQGFMVNISTSGLSSGTYTYYALATDNLGARSAAGTSAPSTKNTVRPPATISGMVFRDADGDGFRDSNEVGMSGARVYLDMNGNDRLDTGERDVLSDATGRYFFDRLPPAIYSVRFIAPAGYVRTYPSAGKHIVLLNGGSTVTGKDFGAAPSATIAGRVFNDLDKDGVQDANEVGAAGIRVYVDANRNGAFDASEISYITGSTGNYALIGLRAGTHIVRAVLQTGWSFTKYSYYTVTVGVGQTRSGINFSIRRTV